MFDPSGEDESQMRACISINDIDTVHWYTLPSSHC